MWMNSINRVDQSDAVSPLNHDVSGAFSRKGKFIKKINRDPQWFDTLLVTLFVFFLAAIDFILFAGSGDLQIVSSHYKPIAEVAIILCGIFAVAALLIVPFHSRRNGKYTVAAIVSALFVYIVFSQFFLYRQGISFGGGLVPISIIIALLFGGLTFVVFKQKRVFFKVLYVIAFAVMFANVYAAYSGTAENKEFEETYNIQQKSDAPAERFIYLMMPNFESYAYLSMMDTDAARRTQDIMQGFYQKNKFTVFSKAYVPENNYFANMIRSFNPTSDEYSSVHRMNTKLLDGYWSFHNLKNEYIFIKNNELYDIFKQKMFNISAYKSRDFDMCHREHKINVDRCVEKINKPINLYNTQLPVTSRAGILAVEWITSMGLFTDASIIYNILGAVMDIEDVPMVGTNFNNLYVVNADKTFDILLDNIKQDTGKQAYFVFIDLPSDMYIYNEYCEIKPQNEWVTMVNLPWIRKNYKDERQNAYLAQMRCLFGKMGEFMDGMRENGLLDNTSIIVQGTSGVNDFSTGNNDVSVEQILNNRIVNMAIYKDNADKYTTDDRFCTTNQILTEYLYPDKKCENDLTEYHQKMVDTVNQQLNLYNRNINADKTAVFDAWFNTWKEHNANKPVDDIIVETYFEGTAAESAVSAAENYGISDIEVTNNIEENKDKDENIGNDAVDNESDNGVEADIGAETDINDEADIDAVFEEN